MFMDCLKLCAMLTMLTLVPSQQFSLQNNVAVRKAERQSTQNLPQMTVEAGIGSYVRVDKWTSLYVTLTSPGTPISGVLTVRNSARAVEEEYSQPVNVGSGASRRFTLQVPGDSSSFEVVLRDDNGAVIATATPIVRQLKASERLIVSISDPPDALNALGALRTAFGDAAITAMSLSDLPTHGAELDAADVLAFRAVDTADLSSAQVRAIQSWVQAGGHLLLFGGPSAALAHAGLADLAPASPAAQILAPVQQLATFSAATSLTDIPLAPAALAPAVVLRQLRSDAEVLAATAQTPLIVRRRLGRGIVDMLAVDPALAPLRSWPGMLQVFQTLLSSRVNHTGAAVHISTDAAQAAATNMPAAQIPSPLAVLAWITLYTLILGPLNLFILRRLRRLHLAWVTLPAITLTFSFTTLLAGVQFNGNTPIVQRLTLRFGHAGEAVARDVTLVSVWVQQTSQLRMKTAGALIREVSAPRSIDAPTFEQISIISGNDGNITGLQLGTRARTLIAYTDVDAPAPTVDASFVAAADISDPTAYMLTSLTNRTNSSFEDCTLLAGRNYRALGNLPPGRTVEAAVPLRTAHPQVQYTDYSVGSPRTQTFAGRYYGSATETSPPESDAVNDEPAPLDLNGAPLTDALVNWANYGDNRQRKEARNGLIMSLLDRSHTMPGAVLGCWSDDPSSVPAITDAAETNQTLSLWHLSLQPYLIDRPQMVPADVYELEVANSSSSAAFTHDGLSLAPGEHILRLQPWLSMRRANNIRASLRLDLRLTSEQRTDIDATAAVAAWNWRLSRFVEIAPDTSTLQNITALSDDFVSADGGIHLRISARGGRITVVRAVPTIMFTVPGI